ITITPVSSADLPPNRYIAENQLPLAEQTHELVKVEDIVAGFQIANSTSDLHGLALSTKYPGMVWLTLEVGNKLVLIDPVTASVTDAPEVIKEIDVPDPGNGPHYIGEYETDLWVSLKESSDVLRINYENSADYNIYKGVASPVFVAQHPINKMFYTGEDASNKLMKINPATGETTQIDVDTSVGTTPVGVMSGPNGIWFTLLGNKTAGTGTFGFIDQSDTIDEEVVVTPTQPCAAHRLLPTQFNVFATELTASKLLTLF
ncbi:13650_t:CDS:2, partial [Racocetra persica]